MRPDLDDFEDLNAEDAPASRAMSWLVLGVAIVGFTALAYYAYQSGTQSIADGSMMTVEAESGPIKEVPTDPGGEEFPHQDKTIYDALSPYRTDSPRKVEKLLPETEEPVIPEPAVEQPAAKPDTAKGGATTYVSKELPVAEEEEEPATPEAALKEEPKPEVKKEEPKKVETKPAEQAPATTSGGDYKIQLGAFKSQAEAEQNWSKISGKHGDVISGDHVIVQADVKGTTYYRLRATGFVSEAEAKAACAKLSSRGQPCFYAGK